MNLKLNIIKKRFLCAPLLIFSTLSMSNILSCASDTINESVCIDNVSAVEQFEIYEDYKYYYHTTETSDKGTISVAYGSGGLIVKHDADRNIEWASVLKGSAYVVFNDVIELRDGGYVVVGNTGATDLGFEHKGGSDAIIVKYDDSGNQQWIKNLSGSKEDEFMSVIESDDGGVITVGCSQSPDAGFNYNANDDAIMVKYSKDGDVLWVNSLAGSSKDCFDKIIKTSDGGFLISMTSHSSDLGFAHKGSSDMVLVKYDRSFNMKWIKNFGGSSNEYMYDIVETSDKGFVFVGQSRSTNAGFVGNGDYDAIIIKCDKNGNQEWINNFGDALSNGFYKVAENSDGGFICAYGKNIVKFDNQGGLKWNKVLVKGDIHAISSIKSKDVLVYGVWEDSYEYDKLVRLEYREEYDNYLDLSVDIESYVEHSSNEYTSMSKTSDGGFIVSGTSDSLNFKDGNNGGLDGVIVKYNSDSNEEWRVNFGGFKDDYSVYTIETSNGDLVSVGHGSSSDNGLTNKGSNDALIVRHDNKGNQKWIKSFGGSGHDYFNSVVETSDSGLLAVGYSRSANAGYTQIGGYDVILVKYNSEGNEEWVKNIGGTGNENAIFGGFTSDDGFVICGYSNSTDANFNNNGALDVFAIKYNKNGDIVWTNNFGGSKSDYMNSVTKLSDGGFLITGSSLSNDYGLENNGGRDTLLIKLNEDGEQEWIKSFGGSGDDFYTAAIEASNEEYIIVGYSNSNDIGLNMKGSFDTIITKYDKNGNQLWVKSFGGSSNDFFTSVLSIKDEDVIVSGYGESKDIGFNNMNAKNAFVTTYSLDGIQKNVHILEGKQISVEEFDRLRSEANLVSSNPLRERFNKKLNLISVDMGALELKTASANLDIYIKSENMLSLSLNTNSVSFENYSGVQDLEMLGAVNLTVNSSLPYQINAYMPTEISNTDGSETMPIDVLNIKESNEADYQQFESTTDKVVLKDGCVKGNGNVHSIDLKLASNQAHRADIYKTVIKFEAQQK